MEREILFRGKPIYEENIILTDFYYGDLLHYANGTVTIRQPETGYEMEVLPETICEFTGLIDKDEVSIFSDDLRITSIGVIFRIYSVQGGFVIKDSVWMKDISDLVIGDNLIFAHLSDPQTADWVINGTEHYGNIHDNK